jgi:hypothetical protein
VGFRAIFYISRMCQFTASRGEWNAEAGFVNFEC